MSAEDPNRKIPVDSQALSFALRCSIRTLKSAAVTHVAKVLGKHKGRTIPAAGELGVSPRALTGWIAKSPTLSKVRDKFGQWGRRPDRLGKKADR